MEFAFRTRMSSVIFLHFVSTSRTAKGKQEDYQESKENTLEFIPNRFPCQNLTTSSLYRTFTDHHRPNPLSNLT